jgi:hypothetical protein
VSPEVVAEAITTMVTDGTAELWVPRWLRLPPVLYALAPGVFRAMSRRFGERVRLTSTREPSLRKAQESAER